MFVRKSTPAKLARSPPALSRNVKFPFLMVTRRTSGATVLLDCCGGGVLLMGAWGGEEMFDNGRVPLAGRWTGLFSVCGSEASGCCFAETRANCPCSELGSLHFPAASCGQTMVGSISATS